MTPLTFTVMPGAASQAYQTASGLQGGAVTPGIGASGGGNSFSAMLGQAVEDAIATGHAADAQAVAAIDGKANLTDVVTAVSKAELVLQTTTTIRDRMVQAYQNIMQMAI
jgi:flagellar hook-basal body complex protein FliE